MGFSSSQLKVIALLSMLIDHIGVGIISKLYGYNSVYWLNRVIGRTAFPIYCFLLVEGVSKTGNRRRYVRDLLVFAIISELPMDIMAGTSWEAQNVYWTLLLGAVMLMLLEKITEFKWFWHFIVVLITVSLSETLRIDYGVYGILMLYAMYILKKRRALMLCASYFILSVLYLEEWSLPAFLFIGAYNGKRGFVHGKIKYIFYWFYPIHLLVITLIRITLAV